MLQTVLQIILLASQRLAILSATAYYILRFRLLSLGQENLPVVLCPISSLEHHLHALWQLQKPNINQSGPAEDLVDVLFPEAMVCNSVLSRVRKWSMFEEVNDEKDTARLEAGDQTLRREGEIVEVMEAEADGGEVEAVVFGPGEGRGCARGVEEVAYHGLGVEGGGGGVGVCPGCETRVVGFDHVFAEVDPDELGSVPGENVGNGARTTGIVEDSDLAGGWGFEGGGWVDEVNTEPGEVGEEEGVGFVDQVLLPWLGGVRECSFAGGG